MLYSYDRTGLSTSHTPQSPTIDMRSRSYYFGLLLALGGTFAAAGGDYRDYLPQAIDIMEHAPLVDGHVDLPFIIKSLGKCKSVLTISADNQDSTPWRAFASTTRRCQATWT